MPIPGSPVASAIRSVPVDEVSAQAARSRSSCASRPSGREVRASGAGSGSWAAGAVAPTRPRRTSSISARVCGPGGTRSSRRRRSASASAAASAAGRSPASASRRIRSRWPASPSGSCSIRARVQPIAAGRSLAASARSVSVVRRSATVAACSSRARSAQSESSPASSSAPRAAPPAPVACRPRVPAAPLAGPRRLFRPRRSRPAPPVPAAPLAAAPPVPAAPPPSAAITARPQPAAAAAASSSPAARRAANAARSVCGGQLHALARRDERLGGGEDAPELVDRVAQGLARALLWHVGAQQPGQPRARVGTGVDGEPREQLAGAGVGGQRDGGPVDGGGQLAEDLDENVMRQGC